MFRRFKLSPVYTPVDGCLSVVDGVISMLGPDTCTIHGSVNPTPLLILPAFKWEKTRAALELQGQRVTVHMKKCGLNCLLSPHVLARLKLYYFNYHE